MNGRSGQSQHGVDVYGIPFNGVDYAGVQCKGKDGSYGKGVTESELRKEVVKAKAFQPPIKYFVLATTAPRDEKIQEVARLITIEHQNLGLFSVDVLGWDEIERRLAGYVHLIEKHYPQYAPPSKQRSNSRTDTEGNQVRLAVATGDVTTALEVQPPTDEQLWEFNRALSERDISRLRKLPASLKLALSSEKISEMAILVGDEQLWLKGSNGTNQSALYWRGRGLFLKGDIAEAIPLLLSFIGREPDYFRLAEGIRNIGNAFSDAGVDDAALQILEALSSFLNNLPDSDTLKLKTLCDLVRINGRLKRVEPAISCWEKAYELAHKSFNPWREQLAYLELALIKAKFPETAHLFSDMSKITIPRILKINAQIKNRIGFCQQLLIEAYEAGDTATLLGRIYPMLEIIERHPFSFIGGVELGKLISHRLPDKNDLVNRSAFYLKKYDQQHLDVCAFDINGTIRKVNDRLWG